MRDHSIPILIVVCACLAMLVWNHALMKEAILQGKVLSEVVENSLEVIEDTTTQNRALSLHLHHDVDGLCKATGARCTGHFHGEIEGKAKR